MRIKSSEIFRQSTGKQLQSSRTIRPLSSGLSRPSRTHYALPKGRLSFTSLNGRTPKKPQSSTATLCEPKISDDYAYIFKCFHIFSAKNTCTYFLTYFRTYLLTYLLTYSMEQSPS